MSRVRPKSENFDCEKYPSTLSPPVPAAVKSTIRWEISVLRNTLCRRNDDNDLIIKRFTQIDDRSVVVFTGGRGKTDTIRYRDTQEVSKRVIMRK